MSPQEFPDEVSVDVTDRDLFKVINVYWHHATNPTVLIMDYSVLLRCGLWIIGIKKILQPLAFSLMQLHRVRDHMTQVQLHLLAPEFFLL